MTLSDFARAIWIAGEEVQLIGEGETISFAGCVQPMRSADASGPAGYGADKRATLYAAATSASAGLCPGDVLRCRLGDYQLVAVEDHTLAGQVVYRRAELAAIQQD